MPEQETDEEYEDLDAFFKANKPGEDALNARVAETYPDTDHPSSVHDLDDEQIESWGKDLKGGKLEMVSLYGDTILVPSHISDTIAGLLNIACRAIEDKTAELKKR